jgi:hypothetical protein
MSTAYETSAILTVADHTVQAALPFPGRCLLKRVAAVSLSAGPVGFTIHNRLFTSPALPIAFVTDDGTGHVMLTIYGFLPVKVGDPVSVAGTTTYDGAQRVTNISDNLTFGIRYVTLGATFSAAKTNIGTVCLSITGAEQNLYTVDAAPAASGFAEVWPEEPYVNQDALPNLNIGVNRVLYLLFTAADTFRVTGRAEESIGMGG